MNVLAPQLIPAEVRTAFSAVIAAKPKGGGLVLVAAGIYWASLVPAIAGMWRLRHRGLWLALLATVASVAQAALLGPHAYSGLADAVAYVSKVLSGVGLGVSLALMLEPQRGA